MILHNKFLLFLFINHFIYSLSHTVFCEFHKCHVCEISSQSRLMYQICGNPNSITNAPNLTRKNVKEHIDIKGNPVIYASIRFPRYYLRFMLSIKQATRDFNQFFLILARSMLVRREHLHFIPRIIERTTTKKYGRENVRCIWYHT